jgi:hypothetical protein
MRTSVRVDQDVRRLEIAMNDTCYVGIVKRFGNLGTHESGLSASKRAALKPVGQILTANILTNDVGALVIVSADLVNTDDVGMT